MPPPKIEIRISEQMSVAEMFARINDNNYSVVVTDSPKLIESPESGEIKFIPLGKQRIEDPEIKLDFGLTPEFLNSRINELSAQVRVNEGHIAGLKKQTRLLFSTFRSIAAGIQKKFSGITVEL